MTAKRPLKLKSVMLSDDGGRTWLLVRQHYLIDVRTDRYLDEELIGTRFVKLEGDEDHGQSLPRS